MLSNFVTFRIHGMMEMLVVIKDLLPIEFPSPTTVDFKKLKSIRKLKISKETTKPSINHDWQKIFAKSQFNIRPSDQNP